MKQQQHIYKLKTRDKQSLLLDAEFLTEQEAEQCAKDLVATYPDDNWRDIYEVVKVDN